MSRPAAVALVVALVALAAVAVARAATGGYWDRLAVCETGGNWRMSGSVYEGGLGFYVGTWRWWASELGLLNRYPHAYLAPRAVQIRVAEMGYQRHHGYWGCQTVVGTPPR